MVGQGALAETQGAPWDSAMRRSDHRDETRVVSPAITLSRRLVHSEVSVDDVLHGSVVVAKEEEKVSSPRPCQAKVPGRGVVPGPK